MSISRTQTDKNKTRQLYYALAYIISAILLILSIILGIQEKSSVVLTIASIMGSYIAFAIGDRLSTRSEIAEITEILKENDIKSAYLAKELKDLVNSDKLIVMSSSEAMLYISECALIAQNIRNTSFSDDATFNASSYKDWIAKIVEAATERRCNIQEVMTSDERKMQLETMFRIKHNTLRAKGTKPLGTYTGFLLKETLKELPFTEFMILEYDSHNKEVLFGWKSSQKNVGTDACFVTKNPATVEYFVRMFDRFHMDTLSTQFTLNA